MVLEVGTRVGPYRVEAVIGSGGFSTVYRARDDRLDTAVAIKVLAENFAVNADARGRFVDEARIIRKVSSDHLVSLHDVGETNSGQPYLVMQLADRGDLHQRLQNRFPTGATTLQLRPVISLLTEGLDDLHSAGLVHRDVKPQNILITSRLRKTKATSQLLEDDERLLLADLGFAKDLELASGYTSGGGTRWFQAPEQLPALVQIDHRADIYAATAVLAWMLTGSVPSTTTTSWHDHLANNAPHLEPSIAGALARGLAEDPNDRPASMRQWQQFFEQSTPTTINTAEPPVAELSVAAGPKRAKVLALVTAVALTGGAAGYIAANDSTGLNIDTEQVDGQLTQSVMTTAGTVTLSGPETIQLGNAARFTSTGPDGLTLQWITDQGEYLDATKTLELTPSTTGTTYVHLQTVIAGQPVTLTHTLDITN